MQYFKNESGTVYAYEDDVAPELIINGLITITEVEAMALSNPPPPPEQLLEQAEAERSRRRVIADGEIEWRQDAVDAGIATDEEAADLAAWRKYRVLLMRVDPANPVWPEMPI